MENKFSSSFEKKSTMQIIKLNAVINNIITVKINVRVIVRQQFEHLSIQNKLICYNVRFYGQLTKGEKQKNIHRTN